MNPQTNRFTITRFTFTNVRRIPLLRNSFFAGLLFLGFMNPGAMAPAQSLGTFTVTGSMNVARAGHTATLLGNGKVLIAGGYNQSGALSSAEIFDPLTGRFTRTGDMTIGRYEHGATLLPDGRVLIGGGVTSSKDPSTYGTSAEVYDPSTGTFTGTGNPVAAGLAGGLLLGNGKVLLKSFGYDIELWRQTGLERVVSLQIFDPVTGTFADAGLPGNYVGVNTCTLLANGKVLITGGSLTGSVAYLYDTSTGTFSPTDPQSDGLLTATLLVDGNVLFTDANNDINEDDPPNTEAKLYTVSAGGFSRAGPTADAWRDRTPATLLPDGTVLITGGISNNFGVLASAEVYDPGTGLFSLLGYMTAARESHTATLLTDGTVLIAGGVSSAKLEIAGAEIYKPGVLTPAPKLFSLSGDGRGQGAVWHAQTGQIASAANPALAGDALSMYTTSLASNGLIPPQVSIGGRLGEILYFGEAPGYPGYYQVNIRVPDGVSPGPEVSVRLTYLGRPSNEVTIAVQ
jgi:Galactose oxidase, central domain